MGEERDRETNRHTDRQRDRETDRERRRRRLPAPGTRIRISIAPGFLVVRRLYQLSHIQSWCQSKQQQQQKTKQKQKTEEKSSFYGHCLFVTTFPLLSSSPFLPPPHPSHTPHHPITTPAMKDAQLAHTAACKSLCGCLCVQLCVRCTLTASYSSSSLPHFLGFFIFSP